MADFPAGGRGPNRKSSSEGAAEVIAGIILIAIIGFLCYGVGLALHGLWIRDAWVLIKGVLIAFAAYAVIRALALIGRTL